MRNSFLKHLLSSVAAFAPPDADPSIDPDGGEERIEFTDDDDEEVTDPQGETDADNRDDQDDEGAEDDAEAAAGAGADERPPARQSRGDRQMGELRRQARERADENARLTRELAELRGQITTMRQQPAETPQQRAERLALMSPEDRIQETVNEALRVHEQRSQQVQIQLMDQADRAAFDSRCVVNPLLKKLAPEIERRLADLRQKGQNLPREVVATYLIGERVMAQQGKDKSGRQQARQRQQARPGRPQGDVGSGRRQRATSGTAEDFEANYGDVPI